MTTNRFLLLMSFLISALTLTARTVYLQPETWDNGESKFAAYTWSPSAGSFVATGFMTAVSSNDALYQTTVPDSDTKIRFYRFNSSRTEPSLDGEWEVTVDLDLSASKNVFIYSGKNGESKAIGSWGNVEEISTFDLVFKDNGSGVDVDYFNLMLLSGESKISDFLTQGNSFVSSFSGVTEADLVNGRAIVNARKGHGVLMRDASFTINLASPRKLDRIEILAQKYNDSNRQLVINGSTVSALDSGRYVIDCKDKVVSSITVATPSGKSAYILAINMFDSRSGDSHTYLADWLNNIGTFTAHGSCSKAGDGSMQFASNYNSKLNYYEIDPVAGKTFGVGDTIVATFLRKAAGTATLEIYNAAGTKLFTSDPAATTETTQRFVLAAATEKLLIGRGTGSSTTLYIPDFQVFQKYITPTISVSKAVKTALGQERNSTSKNPVIVQGIVKNVTLDFEASNKKAIDEGLSELANTVSMYMVDSKTPDDEPIELYAAKPATSGDVAVIAGAPIVIEGRLTHKYDGKSTVAINSGTYKIQKYLVDFVSESKVLQRDSLRYGAMPVYKGATPTKTATAKWTYTFKGWNKTIVPVTQDETYIATFDSTLNYYTVTIQLTDAWRFAGYEGEKTVVLETSSMGYGTVVTQLDDKKYRNMDLHNNQYEYHVIGWTPAYDVVVGDVTYTPQLDSTLRKYPVVFGYADVVFQKSDVEYGAMPEYTSEVPTRPANGEWSYVFKEWKPALHAVEGPQTYTAVFDSTTVRYEITFLDYNFKLLKSELLGYGATPVPPTPSRPSTVEWTYTFKGWDEPVVPVTTLKTYVAQYDSVRNQYQIDFLDYDSSVLKSYMVEYGSVPFCPNPNRQATAQWTYTFKYWDKDIVRVKGPETYLAIYDSIANKYQITFYNWDGGLLERKDVAYGTVPAYTGMMPTKPSQNNVNYVFSGWTPTLAPVTGNASYTAVFEAVEHAVRIIFANYDGTALQSELVELGDMPVYKGETPTREATSQYEYTYKGWDKPIVVASISTVYTAQYDSLERSYEITFVNYDGTVLQTGIYSFGETPVYNGPTPEHPASSQFIRVFAGWDKKIEPASASVTYTARYDLITVRYLVEFVDFDGSIIFSDSIPYGVTPKCDNPTRPNTVGYTYYFKGWEPAEIVYVTKDARYVAQYDSIINKYTVKFMSNGTTLQTQTLDYGTTPVYSGRTPTLKREDCCTYKFSGNWEPALSPVTGDAVYEALFDTTLREYRITFNNEDNSLLWTANFNYGTIPVYGGKTPTKAATSQVEYVFAGWKPELAEVNGATTYTAYYTEKPVMYLISFVNYDGTILQEEEFAYGSTPVFNGQTPQRADSESWSYQFKGWSPTLSSVAGATTYKALFDSTRTAYTINFVNYDGTLLDTHLEAIGATPMFEGMIPQKPATPQWTYVFAGWQPALQPVSSEATYKATFDSVANKFNVEFVNYNGVLLQTNRLAYGETPVYQGGTPTRPATDEYTYTFRGWEPAIAPVTDNVVYTAVFDSVSNGFIIQFVNYDGTLLQSEKLDPGVMPVYKGETPVKPNTSRWIYTFVGWTPNLVPAAGSAIYTAKFDSVAIYQIEFVNYDGSMLYATITKAGEIPVYAGPTPTKPATPKWAFRFTGWNPALEPAKADVVYTAQFDSVAAEFTIQFVNFDGTVLQSSTCEYGKWPTYSGTVPTRQPSEQYDYKFIGWTPSLAPATEDATYTAQYDSTRCYRITVNPTEGFTVTGDGRFQNGTKTTLRAVADKTYTFLAWSDGNTENPRSITVTEDLTLDIIFERDSFTVELSADPAEAGIVKGAGTYLTGTQIEIEAIANDGFEFQRWSDGIRDAKRTILMYKDYSLTALFQKGSGLQDLNETNWINVVGRDIHVSAPEGMTVGVFTVNGQMLYNGSNRIITLPQAGTYLIRIGKYAGKVTVL